MSSKFRGNCSKRLASRSLVVDCTRDGSQDPYAVALLHVVLGDVVASSIRVGDTRQVDQDSTRGECTCVALHLYLADEWPVRGPIILLLVLILLLILILLLFLLVATLLVLRVDVLADLLRKCLRVGR